jgi:N6-adenosine-specific RNA methylase IME4/ParB-like chromosome segregation protein Spo0J
MIAEPDMIEERAEKFQVLPRLRSDDFERLKASIADRGVEVPVVVDEHGDIIDGHHRALIADSLGIRYTTETRKGLSDVDKRLLAVDLNLARRHLTEAQKVLIARQIEPDIAERARQRQEQLGRTHGDDPLAAGAAKGRTDDEVARAVGLGSGDTYRRAKQVIEQIEAEPDGDQLIGALEAGDWDLDDARTELRDRHRQARRDQNHAVVSGTTDIRAYVAGQTFQTIVLDPPWDWGDEGDVDQFGRGRPTYQTMPIDELRDMPIADLATTNAHIYLWITNRSLPKGFALLDAWGFRYVTALTWCKPSIGMGNYFRGSTEHVLFGVRGSLPLIERNVGTWFEAPRGGRHSEKPAEFYQLVERCSPGPWLDVFSRSERPGWVSWGEGAK